MASRQPTYEELVTRLEALEANKIGLKDLPLKSLQNQLELNWQPSASVLLGPASITTDMLSAPPVIPDGAVTTAKLADNSVISAKLAGNSVTSAKLAAVRGGVDSCTWAGTATSPGRVVAHGLPGTPTTVQLTSHDGGIEYLVVARTSTTFTVVGHTSMNNVISGTFGFDWLAYG